ncbi:DNA polymerase III subunit gamma/tau [Bacillus carboniphilus]|uniref:DNA-directed DNA polymerase n=1 Tax=Bacillus carboniphilus TaxID=86663 RepID=A0ABY9JT24_9BACI|nr:DNA polymerase III subunit gamma/tau [Bacillus carboniphilus]WLR41903.1 DNA polymerase III subunit gamma/tau [Bacillus carboniphilus]
MGYQALYRVFRPQTFEDLVGQEHVTKTLQSALLQRKISHAYLFSGPRGTGKTSAAKVFAKAVNCLKSPTMEPCNQCVNCKGITDGSISDVIEIDAASNNGVDEIRDIRDKVKYAPSSVSFKVYIIDEVHMLSIGAFNALLKTLEEPPAHVIFILATTEPHKIPLTIISRCQRFDFKRITVKTIVSHLKNVVENQSIEVEDGVLNVVASAADGGMRDALSLLDQAISFSDGKVTLEDVLTITGSVSQKELSELVSSIQNKDVSNALNRVDNLMNHGKDPAKLIEDLIYYHRDILLYITSPNLEQILERTTIDQRFKEIAEEIVPESIYGIIEVLNKSQQEMKWTNHPRIFIEIAVVKLCENVQPQPTQQPMEDQNFYEQRIEKLENQLNNLMKSPVSQAPEQEKASKKPLRSGFKIPTGRIKEILKEATRQDLDSVKGIWGQLLEELKRQNKVSHAALLNESEPVASSKKAVILKFKYEIHCKMVSENNNDVLSNLQNLLSTLTGKPLEVVGVPDREWGDIRKQFIEEQKADAPENGSSEQQNEDPIISEAKKIVGVELLEIKD